MFPEIIEDSMSSAVVSTSAALGRPFLFDDDPDCEGALIAGGALVLGHAPLLAAFAKDSRIASATEYLKQPVGKRSAIAEFVQSKSKNPQSTILPASVIPASRLEIRPVPEMAACGIPVLEALTGGLPRGCLTEICGPASSGRTSIMLAALAAATHRGEFCALIDANDALDPHSAAAAGVDLNRFLWVRCGDEQKHRDTGMSNSKYKSAEYRQHRNSDESETRLEQVLRATDLLLESGGFGLIVLDLADLPPQASRRIPLTTWFRFRRAVEHKATILLAMEQKPIAGSCSSLLLQLAAPERREDTTYLGAHGASCSLQPEPEQAPDGRKNIRVHSEKDHESFTGDPWTYAGSDLTRAQLFSGLEINVELIRSRFDRKPAHSVTFKSKTAWAAG